MELTTLLKMWPSSNSGIYGFQLSYLASTPMVTANRSHFILRSSHIVGTFCTKGEGTRRFMKKIGVTRRFFYWFLFLSCPLSFLFQNFQMTSSSLRPLLFSPEFQTHIVLSPNLHRNPNVIYSIYNPLKTQKNSFKISHSSSSTSKKPPFFLKLQSPLTPFSFHFPKIPSLSKFVVGNSVYLLISSFLCLGFFTPKLALAQNDRTVITQTVMEKIGEGEEMVMSEKLLEKNPRDVEALKVVVYGKIKRGDLKEAVEYVEKLINVEPYEVEWRILEALCYEMMGRLTTAKRLFKEILKKRPLFLRALHGLTTAMHKNQEGAAVFEMLYKALNLAQKEKRVTEERNIRILIAQMHVMKGDMEEAVNKFQALIDENPRDFRPYLCQGIVYSLLDKKNEAEKRFETYRSLVPEEFPQRGFLDDVVLEAKNKNPRRTTSKGI